MPLNFVGDPNHDPDPPQDNSKSHDQIFMKCLIPTSKFLVCLFPNSFFIYLFSFKDGPYCFGSISSLSTSSDPRQGGFEFTSVG